MTRAVFLDRDGTLNREVSFVARPEQFELLPGVPAALARLQAAGFALVVVTNQSGIARGLYTETDLARVHERAAALLPGLVRAFVHCPHHPDETGPWGGACACRKPKDGLLHQAKELLGLDFEGSYLVGDSARDVLAARDLPVRTVYVHSGKPPHEELQKLALANYRPHHEADDLAHAVDWILADAARPPASRR